MTKEQPWMRARYFWDVNPRDESKFLYKQFIKGNKIITVVTKFYPGREPYTCTDQNPLGSLANFYTEISKQEYNNLLALYSL